MFTLIFALLLLGTVAAGFRQVLLHLDGMFGDFTAETFLLTKLPKGIIYLFPLHIGFNCFGQLLTLCKQLPNFCLQILLMGFKLCQRVDTISG